jgi:phospholipid-translocating P-type ATPase (flippase)
MGISVVMAGIDDWRRHGQDMETNYREVQVLQGQEDGSLKRIRKTWQDLEVGDVVLVENNNAFPADLVMLASADEVDGGCYVDTANLDGETNLKSKAARKESQALVMNNNVWRALFGDAAQPAQQGPASIAGESMAEAPNNKLYTFQGSLRFSGLSEVLPLDPQQLLLRGTVLRNTKWCIGVVIYTGRETRMAMNAQKTPAKLSNLDQTLNKVMFLVVGVQAVIAFISAFLHINYNSSYKQHWYLNDPVGHSKTQVLPDLLRFWLTFFTLYSNLLPISLYSTLEICNLIQARFINNDRKMYCPEYDVAAQVKSTNLCQELGQIAYVFSDKTGTLTQNVMELKRVSIHGHIFGELGGHEKGFGGADALEQARSDGATSGAIDAFLEVLAVSHTVVIDGSNYVAESPDEGALVQSAADLGWVFTTRNGNKQSCKVKGEMRKYDELALNAFNSYRKRMSLLVKNEQGETWLLVKGADNVMLDRASYVPPGLNEHVDIFAKQGLRTLVIGRRRIPSQEVNSFMQQYEAAWTSLDGRQEALDAAAESIEKDLEIVGATAIEDKLQEDVDITISNLKQAGVKVWVLTGDKLDTARIVGFSCAVLSNEMDIMTLDGPETADEISEVLSEFHERVLSNLSKGFPSALMVTGQALGVCLESDNPQLQQLFLEVARPCAVLIACRVSPSQKADIVRLVRNNTYPTPVTLAIGDGANDVPMIQEAQVGIGISGKEGKQASNAADFSIGQFRFLQRLLLVHGRWNYRRTCKFILYSFYKNTVLVLTLFTYSFFCGQSGTSFYEDLVRNSFNIVLALPIICVGVFEQDVSEEVALKYPALYKSGRLGLDLNLRKMAEALLSAFLHAVILVKVLGAAMPGMNTDGLGGYYAFGTAAFSCLIMAMNYRAAFLTKTWTQTSVGAMLFGSFGLYIVFICVYGLVPWTPMYLIPFKVASTPLFWLILIVVPLQAMTLDVLVAYVLKEFFPSEEDLLAETDAFQLSEKKMQSNVEDINTKYQRQEHVVEAERDQAFTARASRLSRTNTPVMAQRSTEPEDPSRSFAFSHPFGVDGANYIFSFPRKALERFPSLRSLPRRFRASVRNTESDMLSNCPEGSLASDSSARSDKISNEPPDSAFLQQTLPCKQLVLTGAFVKWSLLAIAIFFGMTGFWTLIVSERVSQMRVQYDGSPTLPDEINGLSFMKLVFGNILTGSAELPFGTRREELLERDCALGGLHRGHSRTCTFAIPVTEDMEPPIQVLYLVSPFLQNYNRYMRSVDVRQLMGESVPHDKVKCKEALEDASGNYLNPCGLQAQSFFNDSFGIWINTDMKSVVDSSNIVFPSHIEKSWENPGNYGKFDDKTKWLHERFPGVIEKEDGVKDRHFMVHMQPGAIGYAQKKYGVINQPLKKGQQLMIRVDARFPVNQFDGRKFLILTTNSLFGGRNDFLGYELLLAGFCCLLAAVAVGLQQWFCPRALGRTWRTGDQI